MSLGELESLGKQPPAGGREGHSVSLRNQVDAAQLRVVDGQGARYRSDIEQTMLGKVVTDGVLATSNLGRDVGRCSAPFEGGAQTSLRQG